MSSGQSYQNMTSNRAEESSTIPGIALRLTPEANQKQLAGQDHIIELIHEAAPELSLAVQVSSLISSQNTEALAQTEALAAQRDPTYQSVGFETWYQIRFQRSTTDASDSGLETSENLTIQPGLLQLVRRLQESPSVLSVHLLQAGPPPVNPNLNPLSGQQGYLAPAPQGIDAAASWAVEGGDGKDTHIVDIEQGWNLNHEDLVAAGIQLAAGNNHAYYDHGTAVLGEILMVDNTIGGIGISPNAKGSVVSQWDDNGNFNTPNAISNAISLCAKGDFILIEAQEFDPVSGTYYWPVEIADASFQLIRMATALGITVIEPACNGSHNLDQYISLDHKLIFNRASVDYRESGATMVGAGSSAPAPVRLDFSNFGTRIDVFSWGENVVTTWTNDIGTDNHLYTDWFGGTSAASPIIAGAAMNVQGMVKAHVGAPWDPFTIRKALQLGGTPSANPAQDLIGVMPNLKAIIGGDFPNVAATKLPEGLLQKTHKVIAPTTVQKELV